MSFAPLVHSVCSMMRSISMIIVLLGAMMVAVTATNTTATGTIYLTVAYCPDDFTSAGAVVSVNPATGAWKIVGKFQWPDEIGGAGCVILDDPNFWFDQASGIGFLDYTEDFGYVVAVDVKAARVAYSFMPNADFFPGFLNYYYASKKLLGVTAAVSEDGFCSDGCLGYGTIDINSQTYFAGQLIPFKAGMDDTHYVDTSKSRFYLQASYPLESQWFCSQDETDLCMVTLDSNTGAIKTSQFTNFTVYKYAPQADANGNIMAFVEGFDSTCQDPYNNFAFSTVNLDTAGITLVNCISHNATIDEEEWDSSFSLDNTLMATGSGDAEAGEAQVLVFNTQSGSAIVNSRLTGLATALGAAEGLFDVWSVDFA